MPQFFSLRKQLTLKIKSSPARRLWKLALEVCLLAVNICSAAIASQAEFDAGKKLLEAKDYEKALALFDKNVDDEPTNGNYHFWRAKCLAGLGKSKEACAEYKLAALLSTETQVREACRKALAEYKQELPKGSVNSTTFSAVGVPQETSSAKRKASELKLANAAADQTAERSGDNLFKLSSKKLDWNLEMRKDYLASMKSRNDNLSRLALGGRTRPFAPPELGAAAQELLSGKPHFEVPLSAGERKSLSACDIMLILDHSGSMRTMDCPAAEGLESRIAWCVEELDEFADSLAAALPHGFHLLTFESTPEVFRVNNASELRHVLSTLKAGGGTDLAAALREAFRLHTSHMQQPLLIGVISDGEVDLQSCRNTIIEASKRFPLPNGVFITLLQVGASAEIHTSDRISMLDNLKERASADYDPFVGVPFSKLRRDGLGRDLLLGLRINSSELSRTAASGQSVDRQKKLNLGLSNGQGTSGLQLKWSDKFNYAAPGRRSLNPGELAGSANQKNAESHTKSTNKLPLMWTEEKKSK